MESPEAAQGQPGKAPNEQGGNTVGPAESRPWLGVVETPATDRAEVQSVVPDSPAAQAGLKPGDIIERLDNTPISDFSALQQAVRSRKSGSQVRLEVRRGDELYEMRVRLGRRLRDTSDN
jgi:S1-C subfamily serine protease